MWPNTLAGSIGWLDTLAILITNYGIVIPLLCVLFSRNKKLLIHAGLTFALVIIIDDIINAFFFVPRPFTVGAATAIVSVAADSSFPSGHALRAFALSQPTLMRNRTLGIIATVFAVLIAISRVYVGVHYWTDIIAGVAISIGAAYLVNYFLKKKQ